MEWGGLGGVGWDQSCETPKEESDPFMLFMQSLSFYVNLQVSFGICIFFRHTDSACLNPSKVLSSVMQLESVEM